MLKLRAPLTTHDPTLPQMIPSSSNTIQRILPKFRMHVYSTNAFLIQQPNPSTTNLPGPSPLPPNICSLRLRQTSERNTKENVTKIQLLYK